MRLSAPAKINLYLHLTGRRGDGFHLLDSLVAFVDVADGVELAADSDFSLEIDGPFALQLADEPGNLMLAAGRRLADALGRADGARMRLIKNLPVASGIGGGSADAAATLLGLCRLWSIAPDQEVLSKIGLSLGADVPVCLQGQAAHMAGIGEIITPAPKLPSAWLTLVNPGVGLATPAVFRRRAQDYAQSQAPWSAPAPLTAAPRDAGDLAKMLSDRRNDLTDAAVGLVPAVGESLDALARQPGCLLARMSGSGATCFGLFAEKAEAQAAAQALKTAAPGFWTAAGALQP